VADEQVKPETAEHPFEEGKDIESMVAQYGMMAFEAVLSAIKTSAQAQGATAMVVAAIPSLAGACALTEAEHASVKSGAKKAHVIFAEKLAESVLAFDMARVEASKKMAAVDETTAAESAPTP
jgi:hypothetical protein